LGHAKLTTTAHYAQVDSTKLKAVKSPLEQLPTTKEKTKAS
jgi:site-specific recombinase XerD